MPTLSQRIRADIEEEILSGRWPPGHRLPIESELMMRYDCARMTVTSAMVGLTEAGLIVRRKRAGSFVANPRTHAAVLAIPDIQAGVIERGKAYDYRLLSKRERLPSEVSDVERELAGSGKLLEIEALHLADAVPFALERRIISLSAVPDSRGADFSRQAPGSWLLDHVPWTEAEHRISAMNADAHVAKFLNLPVGEACLVLERRTWRGDEDITRVRQVFPCDLYDLVARFTPKGAK